MANLGSQKDASIKLLNSINNAVLLASNKPSVFEVNNKEDFKELVKWLFTFNVDDFVSSEEQEMLDKLDQAIDLASIIKLKEEVEKTNNKVIFTKFNERVESLS